MIIEDMVKAKERTKVDYSRTPMPLVESVLTIVLVGVIIAGVTLGVMFL